MRGRFVLGVELLTGLSIGAAAASAAVALIISVLVSRDLRTEADHMAVTTAQVLGRSLESEGVHEGFHSLASACIQYGSVSAVALFDSEGQVTRVPAVVEDEAADMDEWYTVPLNGNEYHIGILPGETVLGGTQKALLTGLAGLAFCLAVLAVTTPRYLGQTVLTPLRRILIEADRFRGVEGSTAEAARASFRRLIELLHERERQVDELRRLAETRADIVEKRSAAILSDLGSAVLALDGDGRITLYNPLAGRLFNISDENMGMVFPWESTPAGTALRPVLMNLGKTGESAGEFQLADPETGGTRMFGVSESRSPSGEIVILITDVTRIGELERRIAEQDALADIGAASGGISHEMGNTLCALSGFVDLLARGHSDERTLRILREVREEVDSAQALIDSFASFSNSPEPVASPLDDSELLALCKEICRTSDRCQVTLKGPRFKVSADRKLLEACVGNLVRNALETSGTTRVEILMDSAGGNLSIQVSDDGPGLSMDPEEIFRPFRSTKDRSQGNMGLGLPVSRRIVRSMGGELRAMSGTGKGAAFVITLPLLDDRGRTDA